MNPEEHASIKAETERVGARPGVKSCVDVMQEVAANLKDDELAAGASWLRVIAELQVAMRAATECVETGHLVVAVLSYDSPHQIPVEGVRAGMAKARGFLAEACTALDRAETALGLVAASPHSRQALRLQEWRLAARCVMAEEGALAAYSPLLDQVRAMAEKMPGRAEGSRRAPFERR